MVNAIYDFSNFLNEWVESPGFAQGVAFFIVTMFFVFLIDLPYAIMQLVWQRITSHECNLRCEGRLNTPCHHKACPAHGTCPHYQARTWWASFKSLFQRKKDGAT